MQRVKVTKGELMEKLKENRANHKAVFEDALIVYQQKVIEELEQQLKLARSGERVLRYSSLDVPINQTEDYDQAILMLEMSIEDEINLTNKEFACFVMDKWHWKSQFAQSNSGYIAELMHSEGERPARDYGRALDD